MTRGKSNFGKRHDEAENVAQVCCDDETVGKTTSRGTTKHVVYQTVWNEYVHPVFAGPDSTPEDAETLRRLESKVSTLAKGKSPNSIRNFIWHQSLKSMYHNHINPVIQEPSCVPESRGINTRIGRGIATKMEMPKRWILVLVSATFLTSTM